MILLFGYDASYELHDLDEPDEVGVVTFLDGPQHRCCIGSELDPSGYSRFPQSFRSRIGTLW